MDSAQSLLTDALSPLTESINGGVVIAVLVVIATSLVGLYLWWRGGARRRSTVLVFGVSDSGKTLLLSRLCHNGRHRLTVTSTQPNQASYIARGKTTLTMYDLPGDQCVRDICWPKVRHSVRALLLLVDSCNVACTLTDAAACLLALLTDPIVARLRPPLLILCNKQDLDTAKSAQLIRSQLQREINTLCWTQSSSLKQAGAAETPTAAAAPGAAGGGVARLLTGADRSFSFDRLPVRVQFVEGSCGTGQLPAELQSVTDWLDDLA